MIDRKVVNILFAIEENVSILFFEDIRTLFLKLGEDGGKLGFEIRPILEGDVTEQTSLESIVFVDGRLHLAIILDRLAVALDCLFKRARLPLKMSEHDQRFRSRC